MTEVKKPRTRKYALRPAGEGKKPTVHTAPMAEQPKTHTKLDQIIALLSRKDGATLKNMVTATGWLPHTTRAALTGLRKKGHEIASEKVDGVHTYRIAADAGAPE